MKTESPTLINCKRLLQTFLTLVLLVVVSGQSNAQCSLACNDNVQVSVDVNCKAKITPDVVLEAPGAQCPYVVIIFDENGVPLPDDTVRVQHVGKTLRVKVTLGNNSCWSDIKIEDKIAPVVDCAGPDYVYCNDTDYVVSPDVVLDNCDVPEIIIISDEFIDYPCDSLYSGVRVICRAYEDKSGNRSDTCCHEIFFMRIPIGAIDMPAEYGI